MLKLSVREREQNGLQQREGEIYLMKRYYPSIDVLEGKVLMSELPIIAVHHDQAVIELINHKQVVVYKPVVVAKPVTVITEGSAVPNPPSAISQAAATFITTLYKDILGRAPDAAGLTNWVNIVNSGATVRQIVDGFWNSTEQLANPIGNLVTATHDADNAFVSALYQDVLGRTGDQAGIANWDQILNSNSATPYQVAIDFWNSPEHLDGSNPVAPFGLPVAPPIAHPTSPGGYGVINGSLFGPNGPSPLDVHQGYIGDCWLDGALAGTAARSPSTITNMFTALGTYSENGVAVQLYDVRFHTPSGAIVTELVDNECAVASGPGLPSGIPSDGAVCNNYTTNGVLWAMLAEKAYVQAAASGYVINDFTGTASPCALSYDSVGSGGNAAWAISAISGGAVGQYDTTLSQIATDVSTWGGSTMVIGSDSLPTAPNLPGGHAYAVIGYNAATQLFTLDNPWNWTYGGLAYPGEFTCTAAFITQNFDTIAWN